MPSALREAIASGNAEGIGVRRASRDRWLLLGVALVLLGLAVRAALYFPPAMFQIDSDAVLAGLCAFRIEHGQYPFFFPGGTRLSAASCYVAAAYFHIFGVGRLGLALTALTWAALYLVFTLLLARALLGPKRACVALLFAAVPSEQFMTVTYVPWGYGEIVASCAATLWLATRWRDKRSQWNAVCFGLSAGLGIWFSLQTLMATLPAIAWILVRRRLAVGEWLAALGAAVLGMAPFLAGNIGRGFPSLTANWASRPTSSVPQAFENFFWFATVLLPKLLFRQPAWWSAATVVIAGYVVVTIGFVVALRRNAGGGSRGANALRDVGLLLLFAFAACAVIFSLSQAGTDRGWTVRYIAPLYVVVPIFCAIGIEAVWLRSRPLAVAAVVALLVPNLVLYGLPGSALRAELTTELANDAHLRAQLTRRDVRMVYGDYFWVYHLNFDTRERIAAVPFTPIVDYLNYGDALGASPVHWAAIGNPQQVRGWARAAGAHGTMSRDGDLWVFIADRPAANAGQLLGSLRRADGY